MTPEDIKAKEEYDRFHNPEYTRRMALIAEGCRNAAKEAERKRRIIELRARQRRRREVSEKYDF